LRRRHTVKKKRRKEREKGIAQDEDDDGTDRATSVMRAKGYRAQVAVANARLRLIRARLIAVKTAQKRSKPLKTTERAVGSRIYNGPFRSCPLFTTWPRLPVDRAPRFLQDQRGVLASYPRAGERMNTDSEASSPRKNTETGERENRLASVSRESCNRRNINAMGLWIFYKCE